MGRRCANVRWSLGPALRIGADPVARGRFANAQRQSLLADNVERKSDVQHRAKLVSDFDRRSMAFSALYGPRGVLMKALLTREQPLPARRRKQKDRPKVVFL